MILQDDILHLAIEQSKGSEVVDGNFEELFAHYIDLGIMPYEVASRGDPFEWISEQLERELQLATIAGVI